MTSRRFIITTALIFAFLFILSGCDKDKSTGENAPYSGEITVKQSYNEFNDSIDNLEFRNRVLQLCNYEREKAGLKPLNGGDQKLSLAALVRAQEASVHFEHERPDGGAWESVFGECGIGGWEQIGENLAYGFSTPEALVDGWMHSQGHKENILRDWDDVAIGIYIDADGVYWASQTFLKK